MAHSQKMKCLIVDDEVPALRILKEYAGKIPGLEVVDLCENALKALDLLNTQNIDLLFLDIQMPGLTGLEMIKTLKNPPLVILTTAYSQYALEGYELDIVDYLLKPVSFERFVKAVNKASDRFGLSGRKPANPVPEEKEKPQTKDYFFVKANYKLVKVFYDDIFYIEGLSEYVKIHTSGGNLVVLESLKNLESALPSGKFIRIHKSYIAAIDKIDAIIGNSVEIGDKMLPVGKSYKESVLNKLL